ncbi:MAG: right-handed parallel beta-helix repeat-containing protein, partial [Thermoplasmata archaeon]|nr:right-handed parallel beta-helix repeat-containing protein [Thermoplasmata archaeon]
MRRVASIILCALLISTAFAFFGSYAVVTVASAEVVEGEGNCFEITNSTYLNVTLCSSEVVNVTLESIPEVVSFTIENVTSAESTHITISGFEPNETYYRHEDGLLIESFVADVIGNYSYTQDLSEPHHVFILEIASTLYIRDDGTGGDCISIGTWDSGKKTCTLTGDVYETIAIVANGITLDGDGHRVERGTGYHGVGIGGSSVTVMNTEVTGFNVGIYLGRPSGNVIEGNTISNNYFGIYMFYASGHTISGNTFSGNDRGIYLHWDSHTVSGNTFSGNDRGIYLESWGSNTISGNTFSGGLYACSPFPPDPDPDDPFPFLWCYDIRLDTFSNSNTI